MTQSNSVRMVVIGAGFTGLAAAYELARSGIPVTVLERDEDVGGLAGSFEAGGVKLEKFYHHWFINDAHIMQVIRELGASGDVLLRRTRTGLYYANRLYRLSTPMDVMRLAPLRFMDRFRLGIMVLKARRVQDWRALESLTAIEWLLQLAGPEVVRVVWEPLLRGKFGPYAPEISAVWFWNKLKLRGGSRSKGGAETLAYFRGGFAALAEKMADVVTSAGGKILLNCSAEGLEVQGGKVTGVRAGGRVIPADAVVATPALPVFADMVAPHVSSQYVQSLRQIRYLANVCLVLELDRSLSSTYWMNVADHDFPFVGVIEHTNFEPPRTYRGRHIVYLSKYLPESDPLFQMSPQEAMEFSLPHIARMFPEFRREWILQSHLWKARYSQPIVVRHYSKLIPQVKTPIPGLYLCTMAQVYPEDRGTNYAVRNGRAAARMLLEDIGCP